MVKINKLNPNPNTYIFAKLEGNNPGGSVKDRIALKMIEQAEAEGKLTKDKVLLEASSGNTGIAIAMIGQIEGYAVEIVMSEAVSVERQKMLKAYGAKITLTPGDKGTDGAIIKVRELMNKEPDKYFNLNQFSNVYNKVAHYETTAQEIWKQTNGELDYFVAAIGTSGTLMGVGTFLKKYKPSVKIVSAEPVAGHYIQGLKSMEEAIVPEIYNREELDDIIKIDTEEAWAMARRIIREEGIFVGMSSGAAMLAAVKVADKIGRGNCAGRPCKIVTLFPDRGEKYLSTKLFQ